MPSAMLPGNGVSRATDRVRPPAQSTAETDKAKTINLIPFIKNLLTSEAAGLYHRSARCYRTASGNERMPHATFEESEGTSAMARLCRCAPSLRLAEQLP